MLFLHDQALRSRWIQGARTRACCQRPGRPGNKPLCRCRIPDLFDLAAAYAYGLAANHPFNEATADRLGLLRALLKANGVEIDVAAPRVVSRCCGWSKAG
ncbi:hypothetical protein [Roseomonas sp. FDAARGOS_362]|uniref:hypothetical protein n=1 Tax=Roseomonas sp. FDAARGOS_362 TaxID=2018065 RepID=UPI0018672189|nr:hypothetical protein [Roseomonas sp. FDAARGOS_362]